MWPANMVILYFLLSLSIEKSNKGVIFDIQTIEIGHPDHTAWKLGEIVVCEYELLKRLKIFNVFIGNGGNVIDWDV